MKQVNVRTRPSDRSTIQKMKDVLESNGIPSYYYHVGGYAEECVCLERTDGGWEVYTGERGSRYDARTYDDVRSACKRVLDRVAESDAQYRKMLDEYMRLLPAAEMGSVQPVYIKDILAMQKKRRESVKGDIPAIRPGRKASDRTPRAADGAWSFLNPFASRGSKPLHVYKRKKITKKSK